MKQILTFTLLALLSIKGFTQSWVELKPTTLGFKNFVDNKTIVYTNNSLSGIWFYQDMGESSVLNSTYDIGWELPRADNYSLPVIIDDSLAFMMDGQEIIWFNPFKKEIEVLGESVGFAYPVQYSVSNKRNLYMLSKIGDNFGINVVNFDSLGKSYTKKVNTIEAKNMTARSFLINGDYLFMYANYNDGKDKTLSDYVYTINLKTKEIKKIKTENDFNSSNLVNLSSKPTLIKSDGKAFAINTATGKMLPVHLSLTLSENEVIKKSKQQKNYVLLLTDQNVFISKNNKPFSKIACPKQTGTFIIDDIRTDGVKLYMYVSVGDDLIKKIFVRSL